MFRKRYFHILWFFGWTILGIIGWELILPRIGLRNYSKKTRPARMVRIAREFRTLAVQMGGVMIKVGQFLSSRLDILPREITNELANLQDEVAPEPFEPIRTLIESEFGIPLQEKFAYFEETPMASASIGQAYYAKLCTKDEENEPCPIVVVKVQRPQIEELVKTDLAALKIVGKWIEKYPPIKKRVNVPRLMDEFSQSLYEEMDYLNEGKNAEKFAENFKEHIEVRVPQVVWSHTTKRVLTLEDVGGIKITDYAAIEAAGIDRDEVARRLLDTYLKQIFEDGFFHADPHPGNLFVQVPAGNDGWRLTFVDFGMTGTLPERTYTGLRELLIAVGTQDSHRLIQAYEDLGILLPGADTAELERAGHRIFERFWGKSMRQMTEMHAEEAHEFVEEFGNLLYDMPFQIPENLILLGRCVSILSGICTGLNPNFNVWENISPYANSLIEAEGDSKWKVILDEVLNMLQKLLTLPAKTDSVLTEMAAGKLEVNVAALPVMMERVERSGRKTAAAVIFAAFLLAGVQLYLAGQIGLAVGLGAGAVITLLWILFGR